MNQTKRKNRQLSPHILYAERWLVTPPEGSKESLMVFLSEKKALSVAGGIALAMNANVGIEHQKLSESNEWVEVAD